jgi:predicted dehydrogenase
MATDPQGLALDYRPPLPRNREMGIGIVGAGEIVQAAHLPAYRLAGFKVVGIYDVDRAKAEAVAERFGIGRAYRTLDELARDDDVAVVDIAVPARHQYAVLERVLSTKRNVLCQKPLAETFDAARRTVDLCRSAGARAAVNQQMRWAPSVAALRSLLDRGWLGTPLQMTIQVNVRTPWDHWPWLTDLPGMEFMYHSIHYMDSIRYLLGTPTILFADSAKLPGQPWAADTRTTTVLRFAGETRALIADNHMNFATEDDWYATFRLEGTEGIAKGTNGALYDYPNGREDTLTFFSRVVHPDYWFTPRLEGKWFPHAFMGSMGELMRAIEAEREPSNSVEDNLATLRMVFAAMRSATEGRAVRLDEID